jgi:rare lipoprotein A
VNRCVNAHAVLGALLVAAAALLIPAIALASSGGASPGASGGTGIGGPSTTATSRPTTLTATAQPGDESVSASGSGITVATHTAAMLRGGMRFTGAVPSSDAGQVVEIERLGHQTRWAWAPTAHGTVAKDGTFTAFWPANHIGRFQIRAVLQPSSVVAARAVAASPPLSVIVYRQAIATQYGPGFFGSKTACGVTLRRNTLGVANRTLRCGTKVAVYYHHRMIIVPVIDRGPYANHADWDLTTATAHALGIPGTATVGAVSLPPQP